MSDATSPTPNTDIVRVKVGRRRGDLRGLRAAFRTAGEVATRTGTSRVLMDVRAAPKKVTAVETVALGSALRELGLAGKRVAIVEHADHFEDARFLETVAVNRAFCVRAFTNERDAESWLRTSVVSHK